LVDLAPDIGPSCDAARSGGVEEELVQGTEASVTTRQVRDIRETPDLWQEG
jgi:hypothetical protein